MHNSQSCQAIRRYGFSRSTAQHKTTRAEEQKINSMQNAQCAIHNRVRRYGGTASAVALLHCTSDGLTQSDVRQDVCSFIAGYIEAED